MSARWPSSGKAASQPAPRGDSGDQGASLIDTAPLAAAPSELETLGKSLPSTCERGVKGDFPGVFCLFWPFQGPSVQGRWAAAVALVSPSSVTELMWAELPE